MVVSCVGVHRKNVPKHVAHVVRRGVSRLPILLVVVSGLHADFGEDSFIYRRDIFETAGAVLDWQRVLQEHQAIARTTGVCNAVETGADLVGGESGEQEFGRFEQPV